MKSDRTEGGTIKLRDPISHQDMAIAGFLRESGTKVVINKRLSR